MMFNGKRIRELESKIKCLEYEIQKSHENYWRLKTRFACLLDYLGIKEVEMPIEFQPMFKYVQK